MSGEATLDDPSLCYQDPRRLTGKLKILTAPEVGLEEVSPVKRRSSKSRERTVAESSSDHANGDNPTPTLSGVYTRRRNTWLAKRFYAALNQLDPLRHRRRIDVDQLEAMREIHFFVQVTKSDGVGQGDSPGSVAVINPRLRTKNTSGR